MQLLFLGGKNWVWCSGLKVFLWKKLTASCKTQEEGPSIFSNWSYISVQPITQYLWKRKKQTGFFFFPSGSYLYIKSMKWIWNPWKQFYSWNEHFLLHSLSARKVIVNGQCSLSKKCEENCFKLRNLVR